jgi:hypothetical protein
MSKDTKICQINLLITVHQAVERPVVQAVQQVRKKVFLEIQRVKALVHPVVSEDNDGNFTKNSTY